MLDQTCAYVQRQGATVLGPPSISRADALRQLAAVGHKRVQKAIRDEKRAAAAEEEGDGTEAPDPPTPPAPQQPSWRNAN